MINYKIWKNRGHKLLLMISFEKFLGDTLSRMTYFNEFHGHPDNHENLCSQVFSFKEYGQYVNFLNKTADYLLNCYIITRGTPTPTSSIRFHFKLYFLQADFPSLP